MAMKRFVAPDGKPGWYDTDKHDLKDGELVLKSGYKVEEPSIVPEEEPAPKKTKRRKKSLY